MRKHKLSQNDIDLMDITSKASKGAPSHAQSIPRYMTFLGQLICRAMGVNCYYSFRRNYMNGQKQNTVIFYGPDERPEIAAYAFDVLSRQMVKAAVPLLALCVRISSLQLKQPVQTSSAKGGLKVRIRR